MSEDGDSGVVGWKPYDDWSNLTAGILKHMLVDPSGSAPVLRLPMPQTPRYVYPVGVIREQRQNCIWVMLVPSVPEVCHYLTNGLFITGRVNSGSDCHCHQYPQ
jgi:hypothetical protein